MEQALRGRHCQQSNDLPASSGLAEDGHIVRIAAKRGNVGANPFKDSDDVEHPHIRGHRKIISANGSKIEIAIHVEAVIVVYNHDIVIARKALSLIGKKVVPAASGKSSSVHVDHHPALIGSLNF